VHQCVSVSFLQIRRVRECVAGVQKANGSLSCGLLLVLCKCGIVTAHRPCRKERLSDLPALHIARSRARCLHAETSCRSALALSLRLLLSVDVTDLRALSGR
jgi:hypothetical protein